MRATDESVLPGLIDGEKRNVSKYDGAFDVARKSPDIANLLSTQRDRIAHKIANMEMQKTASERAGS